MEDEDRFGATPRGFLTAEQALGGRGALKAIIAAEGKDAALRTVKATMDKMVADGRMIEADGKYRMADEEEGTDYRDMPLDEQYRVQAEVDAMLNQPGVPGPMRALGDGLFGAEGVKADLGNGWTGQHIPPGVTWRRTGSINPKRSTSVAEVNPYSDRDDDHVADAEAAAEVDLSDESFAKLRGKAPNPHQAEHDSEAVAAVVADIAAGRVTYLPMEHDGGRAARSLRSIWRDPVVIDATPIYRAALAKPEIAYYDRCIAPPFREFAVCYRNDHGNVMVMHTFDQRDVWGADDTWETAEPVDWDRVRWKLMSVLWLGGTDGRGKRFGTAGPFFGWRSAIYDDGEPADLTWVQMEDPDLRPDWEQDWSMAHVTLLEALDYLNCRNVEVVEPRRSRPSARRIARTGVKVGQIQVFPVGRSTRSGPRPEGVPVGGDGPSTKVRGHFAKYGPDYGRGLLFGKYAGRFWIPGHMRGDRDQGENVNSYRLAGNG